MEIKMLKRVALLLFSLLSAFLSCQSINASSAILRSAESRSVALTSRSIVQKFSQQKQISSDQQGFRIELQSCQKMMDKVSCSILITNIGNEDAAIIFLGPMTYSDPNKVPLAVDSSGEQYLTKEVQISKETTGDGHQNAYSKLILGIPTKVKMIFKVPPSTTNFSVLVVNYAVGDIYSSNNYRSVQFRNVDISKR
jgi:hypothetical protein